MNRHIVVIGGGAAGMLAGISAVRLGACVTLIERNEKLGKKLYITGKGRCNLTNAALGDAFMRNLPRNPRFLYSALAAFDSSDTQALFADLGVPLKIERGERVFPASDKSSDILKALEYELKRLGVRLMLNHRVREISTKNRAVVGVRVEHDNGDIADIPADAVILATGGAVYPATGSTGDGYAFARELGHEILPPRPALTPIETLETWPQSLMGVTLKNVTLSAIVGNKTVYREMGEMLFTHFGVSGPLVLSASSFLPDQPRGARLSLDLKPALCYDTLNARLLRDASDMPRKHISALIDGLVPRALSPIIADIAKVDPNKSISELSQTDRRSIIATLKDLPLTVSNYRGMDEAIITRGGVSIKGIAPNTMMSKTVNGLYFAGEIIDVDALTGGFNLQIAFSTGVLAGSSAAEYVHAIGSD